MYKVQNYENSHEIKRKISSEHIFSVQDKR